jgi:hypothetical protein
MSALKDPTRNGLVFLVVHTLAFYHSVSFVWTKLGHLYPTANSDISLVASDLIFSYNFTISYSFIFV